MPIVALEGPDCCGKSTVIAELQRLVPDARFVGGLPLAPELTSYMHLLEVRQEALFRQMYDPNQLYICDRSFTVSAEVYSRLYKRPMLLDVGYWLSEQHVFYLSVTVSQLNLRHFERGDPFDPRLYGRCKNIYDEVLSRYSTTVLDGCRPARILAEEIACWIALQPMLSGGNGFMEAKTQRLKL